MKRFGGLALVCLVSGCMLDKPIARINDVAVPKRMDSGYRVIGIDGGAVVRAKGEDATVVPFVELKPGEHTLKIQRMGEEPIEVSSTLEGDKRYRIATKKDGTAVLVEDLR
jgi:hypothetical protein